MASLHIYYRDGDGIPDTEDNCPTISNAQQSDIDGDGVGDDCDVDMDGDSVNNNVDNCPYVSNTGQEDVNSKAQDLCVTFYNVCYGWSIFM